jgi:hypothetical protein
MSRTHPRGARRERSDLFRTVAPLLIVRNVDGESREARGFHDNIDGGNRVRRVQREDECGSRLPSVSPDGAGLAVGGGCADGHCVGAEDCGGREQSQ